VSRRAPAGAVAMALAAALLALAPAARAGTAQRALAPAARAGTAQRALASAASAGTAACAGRAPVRVPGRGDLQVFAIQFEQRVAEMTSYAAIDDYVDCYFRRYVAPYRDPRLPGLVVFNELSAISFGAEGSAGAPARAFSTTPAAAAAGQATNEPLGALGGAIGLVAATHARQLAYYELRFPTAPQSLARVFLALTDTYVRAIWGSFAAAARRYRVSVVVGAPLPALEGSAACAAAGYPGWAACPGWRSSSAPAAVAALSDPDLGRVRSVYVATTPAVENVALVFSPRGQLVAIQPKVNLTPIEQEIGFTPAPISSAQAIPLPGAPFVRLGIAISLDAFEHAPAANPCQAAGDYVGCLAARGANLLLQPEFNDGTPHCPSWSSFETACGPPVWQPLDWMLSSWWDVRHLAALRYAVNPFMVGNLYDLTADGQSAIFARSDPRARRGAYAGDDRARSLYEDPPSLAADDGLQPGFLALAPWVVGGRVRAEPGLPAGDQRSLQSCEEGLVPGSGVRSGPCRENGYLVTALIARLRFPARRTGHRPARRRGAPARRR
jgi:predicted amidohydrolase